MGFALVSTVAIISIILAAIRNVWPARQPILLVWGVFAVYAFGVHKAIVWVVEGLVSLI